MGTVTAVGVGMIMGLGAVLVMVLLPRGVPESATARLRGLVVGDGFLWQRPTPTMSWTAVVMAAASTAAAAALLAAGQPAAGLAAASFGGLGVFLVDAHRRDLAARPVRPAATGRPPSEGGGFWLFLLLVLGD